MRDGEPVTQTDLYQPLGREPGSVSRGISSGRPLPSRRGSPIESRGGQRHDPNDIYSWAVTGSSSPVTPILRQGSGFRARRTTDGAAAVAVGAVVWLFAVSVLMALAVCGVVSGATTLRLVLLQLVLLAVGVLVGVRVDHNARNRSRTRSRVRRSRSVAGLSDPYRGHQ